MNKVLMAAGAFAAAASSAAAQNIELSGFMEFESHYGLDYDATYGAGLDQVTQLDFAVDGRLDFDYSQATKSGLEYGAHFELDLYQSDDSENGLVVAGQRISYQGDIAVGDLVEFNDGYVFLNSSLGNFQFGDTGLAGKATNQLHVPILPVGAYEIAQVVFTTEAEQVFYSNSFAGVDFEVSTDDDLNWSLGIGYTAAVGGVDVELGLSAGRSPSRAAAPNDKDFMKLAGSIQATAGGLTFGANYASADSDKYLTFEYIAAGAGYTLGPLTLGVGTETFINHASSRGPGEVYVSNHFAGLSYEIADGLTLGLGVGNLDGNNFWNRSIASVPAGTAPDRTYNAIGSVKVAF